MILVDTSVWISFFNKEDSRVAKRLKELLEVEEDLCLADLILVEILQGLKDDALFEEIKNYLLTFPILRARNLDTFIHAAEIYRLCKKKARPVKKTINTIIAAVALENRVELFHQDKDFEQIASCTNLKIYKFWLFNLL